MILLEVDAKPIVAGDNDGAGAVDVECERDAVERDLSRKSTNACMKAVNSGQEGGTRLDHLGISDKLESGFNISTKGALQRND